MDPRDVVVVEEAMLLLQSVLDMIYTGSVNKVIIADGSTGCHWIDVFLSHWLGIAVTENATPL